MRSTNARFPASLFSRYLLQLEISRDARVDKLTRLQAMHLADLLAARINRAIDKLAR